MLQTSQDVHPRVRDDIRFGPPMRAGNTIVYHLKDTRTNWFYRLRAQEYFLISRMDGNRTLAELGAEYEATFHRRLTAQSWTQLFHLLGRRALLQGEADEEHLAQLTAAARAQRSTRAQRPLLWRFPLFSPDRLLEHLLPRVRFAFHPAFVYPALVAIVLLEGFFIVQARTVQAELLWGMDHAPLLPLALLLYLLIALFLVVHELAHGVACKYFGGSIQEMGLGWRYIYPFAYCKIDDVVLFQRRRHRVYTAGAGMFANLLMALPVALLWWFSPVHSFVRVVSVALLSSVHFLVVLNLIPFAPLDGCLMLSYLLNMIDLRKHGSMIWLQGIRRVLSRKPYKRIQYQGASRYIYLVYGLLSFISYAVLCGLLLVLLMSRLRLAFHG